MKTIPLAKICVAFSFSILMVACAHGQQAASGALSGPEAARVLFKEGRPKVGEPLDSAVSDWSSAERALQRNRGIIVDDQSLQYVVAGFTDGLECKGDECISLSFRRAKLVNDWLIDHGVSQRNLKAPEAKGNEMPAGFQSTAEERFISRHATIVYVKQLDVPAQ